MAFLNPLSFAQLVQNAIESYNAGAQRPADVGPFSSLGPIFNANGLEFTGLQWQILYLNSISRLQTCTNIADAASYALPFGVIPNGAVAAFGPAILSTNSPAPSQIVISPGLIVQTTDGVQFSVIADSTQPGWNVALGGYVIAQGGTSVTCTVQATIPGSGGNILAQTLVQIVSSAANPAPVSVANVTNNVAFTNGTDAETVSAFITRFQTYMQGRWATSPAIAGAVSGEQTGLTYTIGDQLDQYGNVQSNFFTVFVNAINQASGPSPSLLAGVTSAVSANAPIGMPWQVIAPTLVTVNGAVMATLAPGADATTTETAMQAAYTNYLNNIGLGNNIVYGSSVSSATTRASYNSVVALLLAVSGVSTLPDPPGLTLNGGNADVIASWGQQIIAGTLTVTFQ